MSSSSTAAVAKRLEPPGVPASSKLFQSAAQRTLLLCLLLTAVVLVSYNPVIHNRFLNFDDDGYITANSHVEAGLTWATVKWAFTTYDQGNWHPLTWLSHALDYQLFGLNPAGPHYVNVLLHAVNVVLLFLLLQSATGCRRRSLMVAALFALHPINVESVAWAAERKNVLSMMFFLFALYAYVGYARSPALGKSGIRRYAVVAGFFALALLSKPQVIAFPFLLWLWDYWPLGRIGAPAVAGPAAQGASMTRLRSGWLVLEKLPLLLLSAASAVVTMKAQKAGGAVQTFSQYSLLLRLETAVISYVSYLGKALWPSKLVAMYPHPAKLYPAWQVGAAVVLLLLITALVIRARDQRYLAVGWFWFLGSFVPMIGLVQVGYQAMADRYAYIPFIGLFLMLTWLAADWAQAHQFGVRWLAIPAVSCLLLLGTLTYRQVGYWHDTESFWRRTVALTQDNYIAQNNLGDFLLHQDRTEEAAAHFRAALAIRPDGIAANLNLGAYEDGRGNLPAAIEHYQMVARDAGDVGMRATAYGSLGFAYRGLGQSMKAKQCFETALQLEPDQARAMVGLGLIAQENGDLAEAIRQYSRAAAVQPTDVGYLLLARALQQEGHVDEANAISESVARSSPDLSKALKTTKSLLSGK
ncbi:MAG TPA: tetratricopeptide repeat protein [Terriglobales bacterium]|nr:tetratricopeptide repeat protein [Terriglobales bacterium]